MTASLRQQWRVWEERIDAMSLRERALIFLAMLAVLYLLAAKLVFGPLLAERDALERALQDKNRQTAALQRQIQTLVSPDELDPASPERRRLSELEARREVLRQALARATGGLVSPKEMARLVEQVLARHHGLQVLKLENLPPAPLDEAGQNPPSATARRTGNAVRTDRPRIYKHGMRIELRGRYFDIVEYLRALERLPWKVFWGEVRLETERYPYSRLTLQIYTLSTRRGWIGT